MIVHKEGRMPYNPNIPKTVPEDSGFEDRQPPENYHSTQAYINAGHSKTIIPSRYHNYTQQLLRKGFERKEPQYIYEVPRGSRLAYVLNENKWRSGGFFVEVKESSTKYGEEEDDDTDAEKEYKPYILYKGFNNAIFSVQLEDIKEIWIKLRSQKTSVKDKIVIYRKPTTVSNHPVYLKNDSGEEVPVYMAPRPAIVIKHMNSAKYKNALKNGWSFDDGTQELNINDLSSEFGRSTVGDFNNMEEYFDNDQFFDDAD